MIKQKLFLVLIFTITLTNLWSQKSVNQFDNEGNRHGLWTKNYHNTKQIRYEGVFMHGKEVDTFKYYTLSNGKSVLSALKVFNETDSIAEVTFLASNKKIISQGQMNGKLFIGRWVYYHKNSTTKMIEEQYNTNGELEGQRTVYYKNGTIAEIANYKNGKRNGGAKWFTETGNPIKEIHYKNDLLDGKAVYYDGNNAIKDEGQYTNDQKSGIWTYYKDGKLIRKVDHTNQKIIFNQQ